MAGRWLMVVALAGALGCGCARRPVNVTTPASRAGQAQYLDERHVVVDQKLAERVRVDRVAVARTGDLLNVQVQMVNTSRKTVSVEYRFEWLDRNGMLYETPASRWVIKHLKGGEPVMVKAVAPRAEVEDFVFKINRR